MKFLIIGILTLFTADAAAKKLVVLRDLPLEQMESGNVGGWGFDQRKPGRVGKWKGAAHGCDILGSSEKLDVLPAGTYQITDESSGRADMWYGQHWRMWMSQGRGAQVNLSVHCHKARGIFSATPTATSPMAVADAPAPTIAAIDSPVAPAASAATSAPAEPTAPRFDVDTLDNPTPAYPALSRRLGEQGQVLLQVDVGTDGRAHEVAVNRSSGYPRLDHAALETVRRWTFIPARLGRLAIAASVLVPISFSLKE